jgi:alpha-beta hydrolase superfamily lysophospholipase
MMIVYNWMMMLLAAVPLHYPQPTRDCMRAPSQAARDFAAGVAAAELCTVEGGYHDLLSGAGSRQHAAGIAGWINRSFSMTN